MTKFILTVLVLSFSIISVTSCAGEEEGAEAEEVETAVFDMEHNSDSILLPHTNEEPDARLPRELQHRSVIAYRYVNLNEELPPISELTAGDTFTLALADELIVEASLVRSGEQVPGIRGITAEVRDPHRGFISFTAQDGRLTGNIDLLSVNRLFHLRYDRLNGMHYLAEIDRDEMDIMPESPPEQIDDGTEL